MSRPGKKRKRRELEERAFEMESPYEPENPYQVRRLCERLGVQAVARNGFVVPDLPQGVTREMSHTLAGRLKSRGYITKPQYDIALKFRNAWREAFGDPEALSPERDKPLAREKKYYPEEPLINLPAVHSMMRLAQRLEGYEILVTYFALDTDPVWLNGPKTEAHIYELAAIKQALATLMRVWK